MTATRSPYRAQKMATDCGVSAISGRSRITDLPSSSTRSISAVITVVFPLPVTP